MNFLYLVCNKCENCSEKDVNMNFNKKSSKTSLINNKMEIPNDEKISNDSTNNLEIIDYPYSKNYNEEFSTKIDSNNFNRNINQNNYYMSNINKIKKLTNDFLDSNNSNKSPKHSLNSSSIVINNDDNFLQNKKFLSNFYSQNEKINDNKKNIVPHKRIIIKNKNNKIIYDKKNIRKKIGLKIDVDKKRIKKDLNKNNNKSNSQVISMKNSKRKFKTVKPYLEEYQKIKKNKTSFVMRGKSNKIKSNLYIQNKNMLDKDIFLKRKNFIFYNEYQNKDKIQKNKTPINKLKKVDKYGNNINKIFYMNNNNKSLNNIEKKYVFLSKEKINDSSNEISNSLTNKNNLVNNYRNTTTSYGYNKKNILNFSYLWLNNRDNHYLSKSYINPFDKIENKKKK